MNKIELTCRAANNPLVLKEENGRPTFTSVFCLHNRHSSSGEQITKIPIIVKAGQELAPLINNDIKKGYRFIVSGKLDYWKNPETKTEIYSILAERIEEITEPKSEYHSLTEIEL